MIELTNWGLKNRHGDKTIQRQINLSKTRETSGNLGCLNTCVANKKNVVVIGDPGVTAVE
jgi:hypothetical protein